MNHHQEERKRTRENPFIPGPLFPLAGTDDDKGKKMKTYAIDAYDEMRTYLSEMRNGTSLRRQIGSHALFYAGKETTTNLLYSKKTLLKDLLANMKLMLFPFTALAPPMVQKI